MENIWKAILFGIVEGITEWLPISSTGHLLLLERLFPMDASPEFFSLFLVVVQLFSVFAVFLLYLRRLIPSRKDSRETNKGKGRLWLLILIGTLPAALLGFLLDDLVEGVLSSPIVVASTLILYGVVFLFSNKMEKRKQYYSAEDISFSSSLKIGCFQALSLIPGTSRSGATILGGLFTGCSRTAASDFSFLLSLPVMAGASLLRTVKFFLGGDLLTHAETSILFVGGIVSFLVSTVAVKCFTDYMKKHSLRSFGVYRILLGMTVLFISLLR